MVSESAHLIWKLRCERIIQNENASFSKRDVHNRWVHAINRRLDMDCAVTHPKYESKALAADIVLQTWSRTLKDEESLPVNDWIKTSGVLVGITARQNRTGCG